ncbi:hypothetical protein CVT26_014709 [Gymnopilus dilepis]|uniref:Uncharacterized protein n=1 Tax=Gymnopilus dilepis TaxID=231916 RepID=A0A409VWY7_9AGAR|nr:hypothetical protein CVT26_014709 [Gymnopilus dilepis]
MKFTSLVVSAAIAVSGVLATPTLDFNINLFLPSNHYGAPLAPWVKGSKPGWYYGNNPGAHPGIPCLEPVSYDVSFFICCMS